MRAAVRSGHSANPLIAAKLQKFNFCYHFHISTYEYDKCGAKDIDEMLIMLNEVNRKQNEDAKRAERAG